MVNVSSKNNEISINISTAGNKSNIKLDTPQNYYENLAKHWAVSEKLVNGEDYSSKHYANESKQQAILAKEKADIAVVKAQEVLDNGNKALSNISSQEEASKSSIKTEGESQIANIQANGNTQINNIKKQGNESVTSVNSAGTTQVNLAKAEVAKATEQAKIATDKANEVINSGNNALSNISEQEASSKNAVKAEGDTQVTRLNAAATNYATKAEAKYTAGTGISITNNIITNTQADTSWNPPLLTSFWTDHLLNRMDMLRSDTFSWQNGATYSSVYNELLSEYNNASSTTKTNTVGTVTITYKLTPKGYKICAADQVTSLTTLYNNFGIAWYYVLDTANKQFKLPRTKYGFVGLRDSVGDYIPESLPNIKGKVGYIARTTNDSTIGQSGAFYDGGAGAGLITIQQAARSNLGFNASLFSSTYQDNAPVQQRATQMYLYFYVGEFTQTAIEQTAGLNAELFNGKADLNFPSVQAPYLETTYINGTSWYRIWSDGYCEQGGRLYNANDVANTITLLKTMKNTNYSVFIAHGVKGFYNSTAYMKWGEEPFNFTTTSFQVYTYPSDGLNTVQWKVCGYIK